MNCRNGSRLASCIAWYVVTAIFCAFAATLHVSPAEAADSPILIVQAEDYDLGGQNVAYFDRTPGNTGGQYRSDDVDIWKDGGNNFYTGANATGEWLNFTIDVPYNGEYQLDIRLATPNSNRKVHVEFADNDETGSLIVPNTGGWTKWQTLSTNVALNAGTQVMRLVIDYGGLNIDRISLTYIESLEQVAAPTIEPGGGKFIDPIEVSLATSTDGATIFYTIDGSDPSDSPTRIEYIWPWPFTLTQSATVRAYAVKDGFIDSDEVIADFTKEKAPVIIVQAEGYDQGGQGVAYFDTTPGNAGGQYRSDDVDIWRFGLNLYYTGANATGEWQQHTIDVPVSGVYRLRFRIASPNSGRRLHIDFNGRNLTGPVTLPNTGGWTKWQTFEAHVKLSAGRQIMRLVIVSGGFNLDWIELEYLYAEKDCGLAVIRNRQDLKALSGCTLAPYLIIEDTDLSDLEGLNCLTTVAGEYGLRIIGNKNLKNLQGLNCLTDVISDTGSYLNEYYDFGIVIAGNPSLTSLDGLGNLTALSGSFRVFSNPSLKIIDDIGSVDYLQAVIIGNNDSLVAIKGLKGLKHIFGDLQIYDNPHLTSMPGLRNLADVGRNVYIQNNDSLPNLDGLNSLYFVGSTYKFVNEEHYANGWADFLIEGNDSLINIIDGLSNLSGIYGVLHIYNNISLDQSQVEALQEQINNNN